MQVVRVLFGPQSVQGLGTGLVSGLQLEASQKVKQLEIGPFEIQRLFQQGRGLIGLPFADNNLRDHVGGQRILPR